MVGRKRPYFETQTPEFIPSREAEGVRTAVAALDRARRAKRGVRLAEQNLLRECELAQQHEDWSVRFAALHRLTRRGVAGGVFLLFRVVREETSRAVLVEALVGIVQYATIRKVSIDAETRRSLNELALDLERPAIVRYFAAEALLCDPRRGIKKLLVEMGTNDPHELTRLQANSALLRYGYPPAKRYVLERLRENPRHLGCAHDLWQHRGLFRWRAEEDRELREVMDAFLNQYRRRMHDRRRRADRRAGAARWLIWLADDGLELTPEDVEQAKLVARMCDGHVRKDLNERLREYKAWEKARKKKARQRRRSAA